MQHRRSGALFFALAIWATVLFRPGPVHAQTALSPSAIYSALLAMPIPASMLAKTQFSSADISDSPVSAADGKAGVIGAVRITLHRADGQNLITERVYDTDADATASVLGDPDLNGLRGVTRAIITTTYGDLLWHSVKSDTVSPTSSRYGHGFNVVLAHNVVIEDDAGIESGAEITGTVVGIEVTHLLGAVLPPAQR
jgi:hypothetical protein